MKKVNTQIEKAESPAKKKWGKASRQPTEGPTSLQQRPCTEMFMAPPSSIARN